jgi:hypothetical protein
MFGFLELRYFWEAKDAEAKKKRGIARFGRGRNEALPCAKN